MLEFAEGVPKHVGSGGQSGSRSMCQAVEFPHFSVLGYKPFAYFGSKRGVFFFFFLFSDAGIMPNPPITNIYIQCQTLSLDTLFVSP